MIHDLIDARYDLRYPPPLSLLPPPLLPPPPHPRPLPPPPHSPLQRASPTRQSISPLQSSGASHPPPCLLHSSHRSARDYFFPSSLRSCRPSEPDPRPLTAPADPDSLGAAHLRAPEIVIT
ncbi:hypothetical protein E2C01_030958 [Portunus trituberculatus]|uniref:Uncharacterized protein n=1 Tax=Portunus trituberculatus TaxID=210409 RepID=A0A5B7EWB1_PORTR|nr:hypothetical protein [Portunus trituberculatus]